MSRGIWESIRDNGASVSCKQNEWMWSECIAISWAADDLRQQTHSAWAENIGVNVMKGVEEEWKLECFAHWDDAQGNTPTWL